MRVPESYYVRAVIHCTLLSTSGIYLSISNRKHSTVYDTKHAHRQTFYRIMHAPSIDRWSRISPEDIPEEIYEWLVHARWLSDPRKSSTITCGTRLFVMTFNYQIHRAVQDAPAHIRFWQRITVTDGWRKIELQTPSSSAKFVFSGISS